MAGITLQGLNLIGVVTRDTTTRLGDGSMVEQTQSYSAQTSRRWQTLAQAQVIAQQLRELVWYCRQAGGLYIASDDHSFESGLYRLDEVTATPALHATKTSIIEVELSCTRIGGVSANVARRLYTQATLQTASWGLTSTPWHAFPVGAVDMMTHGTGKARTTADGSATAFQASTTALYSMTGADYNAGECKVWDTLGDATPANWVRVYSPDHQFAQPYHCTIDNGLIRFVGTTTGGLHDFYIYESSGAAWREIGTSTYTTVNAAGGSAWLGVLITELTPWRVSVQWRWRTGGAYVVHTYTIERGRPMALSVMTNKSTYTMELGIVGTPNARFALGRSTADNLNDARDDDTESAIITIPDADDNWVAVVGDTADHDVMAILATRTPTNTAFLAADGATVISQTGAATLSCYIGGIAYDTQQIVAEAEASSLLGSAVTATVSGASGGTPNCASLPTNTAIVAFVLQDISPTLGGTSNITVRAWVRVQNVGTSASDTVRLVFYNDTTVAEVGTPTDKTFAALGSTGTWKWMSVEYTAWNGTDSLTPRVKRQVAGGGGTLYADLCVKATIDSNAGNDGPKAVANDATTENTVWPENARVGV